jgi:hypothetical protein
MIPHGPIIEVHDTLSLSPHPPKQLPLIRCWERLIISPSCIPIKQRLLQNAGLHKELMLHVWSCSFLFATYEVHTVVTESLLSSWM